MNILEELDKQIGRSFSRYWSKQSWVTWPSWIRASWYSYEYNQQDAIYRLIYYSKSALHVSGAVFTHHQENLTVFTVSGSVHPSCCRLVSRMGFGFSRWIFQNLHFKTGLLANHFLSLVINYPPQVVPYFSISYINTQVLLSKADQL
jgi:hypothetical protein